MEAAVQEVDPDHEAGYVAKACEAHRLRLTGMAWPDVAQEVGFLDGRVANTAVNAYIGKAAVELSLADRRQALHLELARLDQLQRAYNDAALSGDVAAANLVLKVIDRRIAIFGFDRPSEGDDRPKTVVLVDGDSEEYVGTLKMLIAQSEEPAAG